jgi:tripartite ATP-independent transporter DctP family solute receptor
MKKLLSIFMCAAMLLAVLAGCASSDDTGSKTEKPDAPKNEEVEAIKDPVVIKFAHSDPEDSPTHETALDFKEYVEAESDGRLQVEIHPNGIFGGNREVLESLQAGSLGATINSTSPLSQFDPTLGVFDIPFMFQTNDQVKEFVNSQEPEVLYESLKEQKLIVIGDFTTGFRELSSNKEINSMDDFKGFKVRTMENKYHLALWQNLGANPTPLAFNELFSALQQGTVEGQENALVNLKSNKFSEVQDYVLLTHHIPNINCMVFSGGLFDSLPEDLQQIVLDGGQYAAELATETGLSSVEEYRQYAVDEGLVVSEVSDEMYHQMVEACAPVRDMIAADLGQDAVDRMMDLVAAVS